MNSFVELEHGLQIVVNEFIVFFKAERSKNNNDSLSSIFNQFLRFQPLFIEEEKKNRTIIQYEKKHARFERLEYVPEILPLHPPILAQIGSIEKAGVTDSFLKISASNEIVNRNGVKAKKLSKLIYLQKAGLSNTKLLPLVPGRDNAPISLKTVNQSSWMKNMLNDMQDAIILTAISFFGSPTPKNDFIVPISSCENGAACGQHFIVFHTIDRLTPQNIVNINLRIQLKPQFTSILTNPLKNNLSGPDLNFIFHKLFGWPVFYGNRERFSNSFLASVFILLTNGFKNKYKTWPDKNLHLNEILPENILRSDANDPGESQSDRNKRLHKRKLFLQNKRREK